MQHGEQRTDRCHRFSTGSSSSATPTSPTSIPQEPVIPTLHPASTRSESKSSTVRVSPSHEPAKTVNTNKKGDNETAHGKPVAWSARMGRRVHGESCGWQCLRTSFSHELPSEPRAKVVSGKHSIFLLISRRTEIAMSAWEPKLQGLLTENALIRSCLERKLLVIKYLRIT